MANASSASAKSTKKVAKKKTAKKKAAKKKTSATKKTSKKKSSKKAAKKTSKKKAAKKKASKKTTKKKASKKTSAKKKASKKKAAKKGSPQTLNVKDGTQLVIVESPAKAKTINKYLGDDYTVMASVGHIRDLPSRKPRGSKQPVPGVDIENRFAPTYEILSTKNKTVSELKRVAKKASKIWFATDLDREGEAIAWHLAEELGIDAKDSLRVVFNAITQAAIERAFSNPRTIDLDKVNAQQARRILDRIVGYQVSPLLWKKVASKLSAGRVQSVAVRVVVEREREIEAFVPDESWKITARLASGDQDAPSLGQAWEEFLADLDEKGKGPTLKRRNAWMAERSAVRTELYELGGERFKLETSADECADLSKAVTDAAEATGLENVKVETVENPEGKGPARFQRTLNGTVAPGVRYAVSKIEQKTTSSRPPAPFITSSLQIAAANQLGFSARRTMTTAQGLYEGVVLGKEGQTALITYMRTDSTYLSGEAIESARSFIGTEYGEDYLPAKANVYASSNKDAQEAHEAIRPTDVSRHPDAIRPLLKGPRAEDQYKLYKLIWSRFVGCQMTAAKWKQTAVLMRRTDKDTGAVVRATGRTLAFKGYYRATGVPTASDEQTLPALAEKDALGAFAITADQKFSSPPPRYSEASLVKTLEAEGIGRPSTYASIISVIQDRNYVEQRERRFYATDLGEVVTDKLIEAFPDLMSVGYTRAMEQQLDEIEDNKVDWVEMLEGFYGTFKESLETAHESMTHAKAETQAAPYKCPKCGAQTNYRFGRNGRFLSCSTYPECDYAAPIDRAGRPLLPEEVDIACPDDGSLMEKRTGRFGPFLASVNYPETKYVINLDKGEKIKYPAVPPLLTELECPKCDSPLNLRRGKRGPWLGCSRFPKCRGRMGFASLPEDEQKDLEKKLAKHEAANPIPDIVRHSNGEIVPNGAPLEDYLIVGGVAELEIHPDADPASLEGRKRSA